MAKFGVVSTRLADLGVRIKVASKRDLVFSALKWNDKNIYYNSFSFFCSEKNIFYILNCKSPHQSNFNMLSIVTKIKTKIKHLKKLSCRSQFLSNSKCLTT